MEVLINFYSNTHSTLDNDDEVKLKLPDVIDVVEYVRRLEKDRDFKITEIENCKMEKQSLLNDIDILEGLYKDCFENMVKQENLITLLRQSYLDHREEEINWKTEIQMLQKKLDNANNINSQLYIQDDMDAIKGQLMNLQNILNTADEPISNNSTDKMKINKNKTCVKFRWKITKLKNTIKRQKLQRGNNNQDTVLCMNLFKEMCYDKWNCMTKNAEVVLENINRIEREMNDMKKTITSLQESSTGIRQNQDDLQNVTTKYNELVKSYATMGEQMNYEHSTIQWLESELQESAMKGAEICCESKQIFANIKNWLYLVKKERRCMITKIKKLTYINKLYHKKITEEGIAPPTIL